MLKFFSLLFVFLPLTVYAGAVDKLKDFISSTRSAQADFSQEVQDKNGKRMQSASGSMQFVRPGKFRWVYQKPYEQYIIGDGTKFWLYDVDLNQVTVRKLDAALGSSPAALLAGDDEIERSFVLSESGKQDGMEWLQAVPRAQDTSFEKVRMAFDAHATLTVMELYDSFGQKTVLKFSNLRRNPAVPAQTFKFVPPKGADVLGE